MHSTNTPSACEVTSLVKDFEWICKLKEEVLWQRYWLTIVFSVDPLHFDNAFGNMVAKMVIFDANMMCPRTERMWICRFIIALVILKDGWMSNGVADKISYVMQANLWRRALIGMMSQVAWERAMYLASVVDKLISDCNYEDHRRRQGGHLSITHCCNWPYVDIHISVALLLYHCCSRQ